MSPTPISLVDNWGDFDHQHRRWAIRVAHSIVREVWPEQSDEAEDIANEALGKAAACLHQYDRTRPAWPWLRRIVVTTAVNRLRRFSERLLGDAAEDILQPELLPDEQVANEEERTLARGLIANAVATLPIRDRELLLRFYVQEEPVADLARFFGVAVQTVRGAVTRAKKAVQIQLGLRHITNREMKILLAI